MFPTVTATSKLTSIAIRVGLLCALGLSCYFLGSSHGKQTEKAKWDQQVKEQLAVINTMRIEYAHREGEHRQTIEALASELKKDKEDHEKTLADINAHYAQRLRTSEQRFLVYQRQAAGHPTDTRNLASHAARLDASLEEGRQLVEEFRATLGLREDQLRRLGAVIRADRQLFTEPKE